MGKKNQIELAVDILVSRVRNAKNLERQQYKGKDPYRQKKVDPVEQLYTFNTTTPDVKEQLKQEMPDAFAKWEADMLKIQDSYNGGA